MNSAHAAPLGIALLGFLLGMRHATDPDHVIAVTTILSREQRVMTAARIGVVWGLGHTVTVLLVGAAIIIFKIAIPTRLGLAMEFAVAVVLILLGVGAAVNLARKFARVSGTSSDHENSHENPVVLGQNVIRVTKLDECDSRTRNVWFADSGFARAAVDACCSRLA